MKCFQMLVADPGSLTTMLSRQPPIKWTTLIVCLPLLSLCCESGRVAYGSVIFLETEFVDSNWDITFFESSPSNPATGTHVASGGNPGAFRETVTSAPGGGATTLAFHRRIGAGVDPSVQGRIQSLDFAIDFMHISGDGVTVDLALVQDGEVFIPVIGNEFVTTTGTGWHTITPRLTLTAVDFGLLTAGVSVDPNTHPNFSGSLIEFGFHTNRTSGAFSTQSTVGFDNWSVSVNQVPEPSSFALLSLAATGCCGFRLGRRRKAR